MLELDGYLSSQLDLSATDHVMLWLEVAELCRRLSGRIIAAARDIDASWAGAVPVLELAMSCEGAR